jgi:hypothetical protein
MLEVSVGKGRICSLEIDWAVYCGCSGMEERK